MHKDIVLIISSDFQTGRELKPEHLKITRGIHSQKLKRRLSLTTRNTKEPEPPYYHCFLLAELLKTTF